MSSGQFLLMAGRTTTAEVVDTTNTRSRLAEVDSDRERLVRPIMSFSRTALLFSKTVFVLETGVVTQWHLLFISARCYNITAMKENIQANKETDGKCAR